MNYTSGCTTHLWALYFCVFCSLTENAKLLTVMQIRIEHVDDRWSSSVMIGVVCLRNAHTALPSSALDIRWPCCIICDDSVYKNGTKVCCAILLGSTGFI